MVLKLHGAKTSGFTKGVMLVLHEKEVPYELVLVDTKDREHKTPAHLEHHPFGQVPFIIDDGFVLYELRAIARYISASHASQGTPLIPTDLKALALFEQAASIETSNFFPPAAAVLVENYFNPALFGIPTDETVAAQSLATLESKLAVYETILSKQKYLAGNEITLADLFHVPVGHVLFHLAHVDVLISGKYPAVTNWWASLISRPSWKAVLAATEGT